MYKSAEKAHEYACGKLDYLTMQTMREKAKRLKLVEEGDSDQLIEQRLYEHFYDEFYKDFGD